MKMKNVGKREAEGYFCGRCRWSCWSLEELFLHHRLSHSRPQNSSNGLRPLWAPQIQCPTTSKAIPVKMTTPPYLNILEEASVSPGHASASIPPLNTSQPPAEADRVIVIEKLDKINDEVLEVPRMPVVIPDYIRHEIMPDFAGDIDIEKLDTISDETLKLPSVPIAISDYIKYEVMPENNMVKLKGRHVMRNVIETNQPVDTILSLKDGKVGAHRIVLVAVSEFLEELLIEQEVLHTITLILPDITKRTMETLLNLAYTGKLIYFESDKEEVFSAIETLRFCEDVKLTTQIVLNPKPRSSSTDATPGTSATAILGLPEVGEEYKTNAIIGPNPIKKFLKTSRCNICSRSFDSRKALVEHLGSTNIPAANTRAQKRVLNTEFCCLPQIQGRSLKRTREGRSPGESRPTKRAITSEDGLGANEKAIQIRKNVITQIVRRDDNASIDSAHPKTPNEKVSDSLEVAVSNSCGSVPIFYRSVHVQTTTDEFDIIVAEKKKTEELLVQLKDQHAQEISVIKTQTWCVICEKEAKYNCCWKVAYCSSACQDVHWRKGHDVLCRRDIETRRNYGELRMQVHLRQRRRE